MSQDIYMVMVTGILLVIVIRYLNDNFGIYKKQFADYVTDHRITSLENGQTELHNKIDKVSYESALRNSRCFGGTVTSLDYCSIDGNNWAGTDWQLREL